MQREAAYTYSDGLQHVVNPSEHLKKVSNYLQTFNSLSENDCSWTAIVWKQVPSHQMTCNQRMIGSGCTEFESAIGCQMGKNSMQPHIFPSCNKAALPFLTLVLLSHNIAFTGWFFTNMEDQNCQDHNYIKKNKASDRLEILY